MNEMETEEANEDEEAEFTRGTPRALNDEDSDYIQMRCSKINDIIQTLNLNEQQVNLLRKLPRKWALYS